MATANQAQFSLNLMERFATLAAAAFMLWLSLTLVLYPQMHRKEERDSKGQITKLIIEQVDHKEVSMLFATSSLILFFWGINGLRLAKLTVGSVSAETNSPEVQAGQKFADKESAPKEVALQEAASEIVDNPQVKESGTVATQDGPEAVYSITSVPAAVLEDLFKNWPTEFAEQKPKDYSTFEFAIKKRGKGNHPWTVKFADLPAFKITYGGQGKGVATVAHNHD